MQDVRSLVNQTKFDLDTSHMSGGYRYTEEYKKKLSSMIASVVKKFQFDLKHRPYNTALNY